MTQFSHSVSASGSSCIQPVQGRHAPALGRVRPPPRTYCQRQAWRPYNIPFVPRDRTGQWPDGSTPTPGETFRTTHPPCTMAIVAVLPHRRPKISGRKVSARQQSVRRMFELLKGSREHRPLIQLNSAFRSDLAWWHTFLERWNGVSMLESLWVGSPNHHLFTDASGALGWGAWSGIHWFQYFWPSVFAENSIAVKELIPIVLACIVWGHM